MDGILDDGRTGKLWMCSKNKNHAIGIIMRVRMGSEFINQLLLFRFSLDVGEVNAIKTIAIPPVRTMGYVEGTMHDIECDCCGAKRTWWIDRKLVSNLVGSLYDKTLLPKGG